MKELNQHMEWTISKVKSTRKINKNEEKNARARTPSKRIHCAAKILNLRLRAGFQSLLSVQLISCMTRATVHDLSSQWNVARFFWLHVSYCRVFVALVVCCVFVFSFCMWFNLFYSLLHNERQRSTTSVYKKRLKCLYKKTAKAKSKSRIRATEFDLIRFGSAHIHSDLSCERFASIICRWMLIELS